MHVICQPPIYEHWWLEMEKEVASKRTWKKSETAVFSLSLLSYLSMHKCINDNMTLAACRDNISALGFTNWQAFGCGEISLVRGELVSV